MNSCRCEETKEEPAFKDKHLPRLHLIHTMSGVDGGPRVLRARRHKGWCQQTAAAGPGDGAAGLFWGTKASGGPASADLIPARVKPLLQPGEAR